MNSHDSLGSVDNLVFYSDCSGIMGQIGSWIASTLTWGSRGPSCEDQHKKYQTSEDDQLLTGRNMPSLDKTGRGARTDDLDQDNQLFTGQNMPSLDKVGCGARTDDLDQGSDIISSKDPKGTLKINKLSI